MKKWYTTAAVALTLAATVTALAVSPHEHSMSERMSRLRQKQHTERIATGPHKEVNRQPQAARISSPILSGDKQLYGTGHDSAFDGVFPSNPGPAKLSSTGDHERISSQSINVEAGCYFEGKFLAFLNSSSGGKVSLDTYDAETWEKGQHLDFVGTEIPWMPADVTFDPETRRIYGVFFEDANEVLTCPTYFGYIDPANVDWNGPVRIASLEAEIRGVASDANGQLFAVCNDSHIYKLNKHTGELTDPVEFTLPQGDGWGDPYEPFARGYDAAEIDYETGDLFFSYLDGEADGFIVKIDLSTGELTMLYNSGYFSGGAEYSEAITALWFEQSVKRSDSTPASPTDVTLTPKGITLDATVQFKLPEVDINGNALTGNVSWSVSDGVTDFASGSDPAGTVKAVDITVKDSGMAQILVTAQSGDNKSVPASASAFIGPDTPQLLNNPTAMADGQTVTIFWDEPYAEHRGNLGDVTYRVTRAPGDVVIAEAATETSVTDVIESNIKNLYTYSVTPMAAGMQGATKTARSIYVGELLELPYSDDFTDATRFGQYVIVDANNDSNSWYINAQNGRAVYPSNVNKADDYLLIGPFELVGGNLYDFEMTADGHSVPEKVAAYVTATTEITPESLTEIIPETVCNPTVAVEHLTGSFTPETNGRYYFAIKACSNASAQNLYIYDVKISGTSSLSPGAPTDVKGVAGENDYTINCVLPTKTLNGGSPANITSVVVYRDNEKLAEITENVADGRTFSYTDRESAKDGEHIYRIAAVNNIGEGLSARIKGWRGPDTPAPPTNLRIYQDIDDPTKLHFTMTPPSRGIHGGYIDPSDLTYYVDYLSLTIGSGVVNCGKSPDFVLHLNSEQVNTPTLIACSVYAANSHGNSGRDGWNTKSVHIGPASPLPLRESWANGTHKSGIWSGQAINEGSKTFEALWDCSMGLSTGVGSQDDDGYMMSLHTYVEDTGYRLLMPRVSVAGTDNPTMVFYYRYSEAATGFALEILVDDQPIATLKQLDLSATNRNKWMRQEIPLSQYKNNKYIQLAVRGNSHVIANDVVSIDNISFIDLKAKDLTAISGSTPSKMYPNEDVAVNVKIRNSGKSSVGSSDYQVVLKLDGREVARREGLSLDPDEAMDCVMDYTPSVTDPEAGVFTVNIDYADDMNKADNIWSSEPVKLALNDYPAPRELQVSSVGGVTLEWVAPDRAEIPTEQETETFDNREPFSITDFGDFTLHDGDNAPTVTMATALGPLNYPHIGEAMAWQIMDPTTAGILNGAWYARSGEQFAVSFQACFGGTREKDSDDWLISPALTGKAQKITFFARAGLGSYAPEIMDVKYSTTGNAPEDFIDLATDVEVPYASDWVEYTYRLPEGTKYFAIVHKSYNKFALLVDDISYSPAGSVAPELTLVGYNVYRDGVRINDKPVTGEKYVDATAKEGTTYKYHVSAVWDRGESRVSNLATISAGAAGIINVSDQDAGISISGDYNSIRVKGANGLTVKVITPDGVNVSATKANGQVFEIPAAPGIYIVTAGSKVAKVIVR